MNAVASKRVGDVAAQSTAAAGVLEELGIDYCCGGQRSLEEACRDKGIQASTVLEQVEAAEASRKGPDRNWTEAPLTELIQHILKSHHEYLRRELPLIAERIEAVRTAHAEQHETMLGELQDVFEELRAELGSHMQKEEMILFPYVERAEMASQAGHRAAAPPFGTFRNPIEIMEMEHDEAGRALREIRRLTEGFTLPEDACNKFGTLYAGLKELERDMHTHIHLENNILFPRALALE